MSLKNEDTVERQLCKDGSRVWSYEGMKQGLPRVARNHQKLEWTRNDPPQVPSERVCPPRALISDFRTKFLSGHRVLDWHSSCLGGGHTVPPLKGRYLEVTWKKKISLGRKAARWMCCLSKTSLCLRSLDRPLRKSLIIGLSPPVWDVEWVGFSNLMSLPFSGGYFLPSVFTNLPILT